MIECRCGWCLLDKPSVLTFVGNETTLGTIQRQERGFLPSLKPCLRPALRGFGRQALKRLSPVLIILISPTNELVGWVCFSILRTWGQIRIGSIVPGST